MHSHSCHHYPTHQVPKFFPCLPPPPTFLEPFFPPFCLRPSTLTAGTLLLRPARQNLALFQTVRWPSARWDDGGWCCLLLLVVSSSCSYNSFRPPCRAQSIPSEALAGAACDAAVFSELGRAVLLEQIRSCSGYSEYWFLFCMALSFHPKTFIAWEMEAAQKLRSGVVRLSLLLVFIPPTHSSCTHTRTGVGKEVSMVTFEAG